VIFITIVTLLGLASQHIYKSRGPTKIGKQD
jgi:hypothetical protein